MFNARDAGGQQKEYPTPNSNGLTVEQNKAAVDAVHKLKVHDLQNIIAKCGIRARRQNKAEMQKLLYNCLFEQQYAQEIWRHAVYAPQAEMQQRRVQAQVRVQPYSIPNGRNGASNHMVNHHYHQQQIQQSIPQQIDPRLPTSNNYYACKFEMINLPFYDVLSTLLTPVQLHPSSTGAKQSKQANFTFPLTLDQRNRLQPDAPLPRHEIQLRIFDITNPVGVLKEDYPVNCMVKVDETSVVLPNVIPTNKPNVEAKRPSRPVNITKYATRSFQSTNHRLNIEWLGDHRTFAAAVFYVHRVTSDILFQRMEQNPEKRRLAAVTKQEIKDKLTGGEDDIAMDVLKICLLDPLSKSRMKTPSRGGNCTHLQCFDLLSYLMMNEKKPTWLCPVCSNSCPYEGLIIDNYFLEMLNNVDKNTTEIELKEDGSFDVVKEDDEITLSDEDEDDIKPFANGTAASSSNGTSSADAMNGGKKKKPAAACDDVITLSDDEDEALSRAPVAAAPPPAQTPPQNRRNGGDNSIEIITLDDTPPRPQPVRQISQQQLPQNQPMPTSSAAMIPSASNNPSPPNLYQAMSRISGARPSQSSSQPSPITPHMSAPQPLSLNYGAAAYHSVAQSPVSTPTSQYSFSPVILQQQQQAQHQFQMQNGMIGRNNQMAQIQQPPHLPPPQAMMSNGFYQQQMGNGVNSRSIPPPRLLVGQELRGISNQPRKTENPPPGVTVRSQRRMNPDQ